MGNRHSQLSIPSHPCQDIEISISSLIESSSYISQNHEYDEHIDTCNLSYIDYERLQASLV